ncbi:MAG: hypothetical protein MUC83_01610 [Pirellula sp.]|nr:hypothetical protein [Pirellula sp.]
MTRQNQDRDRIAILETRKQLRTQHWTERPVYATLTCVEITPSPSVNENVLPSNEPWNDNA